MKLTAPAWSIALICTIGAAASDSLAAIYIHDSSSPLLQPSPQLTLSPAAARCVLAQRANVLQYHTAHTGGWLSDEIVAAINDYGVHTSLAKPSDLRRATILLEGVEDAALVPALSQSRKLAIDPVPSYSDARELLINLARQTGGTILDEMSQSDAMRTLAMAPVMAASGDIFYIAHTVEEFTTVWKRLVGEEMHITAISLPSATGAEHFQWGPYEMPGAHSLLRKRQEPINGDSHTEKKVASSRSGQLQGRQESTYNGSLSGILPACFPSQSACESMTLNCTGHGACVKKYSDSNDPSSGSSIKACFTCQCRSASTTNSQGQTKTTYWGGPACQKRDVSSPFWLLALFTIGMVFLVGFAIGQIWGMGEEELPSVIGAGVSGPVRRS